jgi:hypothetical protein
MEVANLKHGEDVEWQHRCLVCEAHLSAGDYLCSFCERRGLNSLQRAQLFWEEV